MFPIFIILALFLVSLTKSAPMHEASEEHFTQVAYSIAPDISAPELAKRATAMTTAILPFDGFEFNQRHLRADHEAAGDVFRVTKCYCIDTPSRDLPAAYGQFYGNYYGFDYYNYHNNKSYSFSWTCASGELETLNGKWTDAESYYLAPQCLSWMEEQKGTCWQMNDGNEFCAQVKKGYDYYWWNGQKRRVLNHPPAQYTVNVTQPVLMDACQRACQTVPARTPGYMQDAIPYDHEHRLNLATATVCAGEGAIPGFNMHGTCDYSWEKPKINIPRKWDTWNWIETYTDQADMCKGCA